MAVARKQKLAYVLVTLLLLGTLLPDVQGSRPNKMSKKAAHKGGAEEQPQHELETAWSDEKSKKAVHKEGAEEQQQHELETAWSDEDPATQEDGEEEDRIALSFLETESSQSPTDAEEVQGQTEEDRIALSFLETESSQSPTDAEEVQGQTKEDLSHDGSESARIRTSSASTQQELVEAAASDEAAQAAAAVAGTAPMEVAARKEQVATQTAAGPFDKTAAAEVAAHDPRFGAAEAADGHGEEVQEKPHDDRAEGPERDGLLLGASEVEMYRKTEANSNLMAQEDEEDEEDEQAAAAHSSANAIDGSASINGRVRSSGSSLVSWGTRKSKKWPTCDRHNPDTKKSKGLFGGCKSVCVKCVGTHFSRFVFVNMGKDEDKKCKVDKITLKKEGEYKMTIELADMWRWDHASEHMCQWLPAVELPEEKDKEDTKKNTGKRKKGPKEETVETSCVFKLIPKESGCLIR